MEQSGRVLRTVQRRYPLSFPRNGWSEQSPEELYVKKEEYTEILQWIEELPRDYRQALILFCVEGMSYQEIAAAMGKNLAQVRIILYRARKKLQRQRREQE